MPSPLFTLRAVVVAGAGLVAAALCVAPASARDATGRSVVPLAPGLEREWLLQVSPGSGAVSGTAGRRLAERVSNPKTRTYPGYANAVPGAYPGYAMPAARASRNTRAAIVPQAQGEKPRKTVATGIFAGLRRPAAPAARKQAPAGLDPVFLPQEVAYAGREAPGSIVIDTNNRFLYLVGPGGTARRYGVGVGKPGFEWAGRHRVTRKSEWPTWTPPAQMRARERAKGRILPVSMAGGPENPLGARAMYLGSTLYRIHGTNQPWTIGKAVSSGCIRMRNEDVTDLYERVPVGTGVTVL